MDFPINIDPFGDITGVSAVHHYGSLGFKTVRQDKRVYFALLLNGRQTGTLTTAERARETIAYWRLKGWAYANGQ